MLGILNSTVFTFLFDKCLAKLQNGYYEHSSIFMKDLPVFVASDDQKAPIIKRVQTILAAPDAPGISALEKEIDELVYQLYGLTTEDIVLIEWRS